MQNFTCYAGAVAEMTGRRGRVVADAKGRGVYELRAKPDSTEMDSLNVSETGMNTQHLYCNQQCLLAICKRNAVSQLRACCYTLQSGLGILSYVV